VALVVHQAGQMLPCRLVGPKTRRRKNGNKPKMVLSIAEPVSYGQLRFAL